MPGRAVTGPAVEIVSWRADGGTPLIRGRGSAALFFERAMPEIKERAERAWKAFRK